MQFQFLDFCQAGFADLACDCGAKFGISDDALENALRHVAVWHCTDEQRGSRSLLLGRIALFLSPNPILLDGDDDSAAEVTHATQ
jgi:hypothetical protein